MRSTPRSSENRFRKTLGAVGVFGAATAGAVYTTLTMRPIGLAAGCVLLSLAAAIVVGREDGVHDPADEPIDHPVPVTDGGRRDD